jgi:RNA polymerase sigma factor for flagellar operon FliA
MGPAVPDAGLMGRTATDALQQDWDARTREALPIVHHVVAEVARRVPRHVERDDLMSAAMLGLVQAARAFDPDRGIPFSSFARTRIKGAVLDELRSRDWLTRRSRARARIVQGMTADDLPARAGLAAGERQQVHAELERARSLEHAVPLGQEAGEVASADPGPEARFLDQELVAQLHHAIDALPARLRVVVVEYFFEGHDMQAIAAALGVTRSRVSQLCAEAVALLRAGINGQAELEPATVIKLPTGRVGRRTASFPAALAGATARPRSLVATA